MMIKRPSIFEGWKKATPEKICWSRSWTESGSGWFFWALPFFQPLKIRGFFLFERCGTSQMCAEKRCRQMGMLAFTDGCSTCQQWVHLHLHLSKFFFIIIMMYVDVCWCIGGANGGGRGGKWGVIGVFWGVLFGLYVFMGYFCKVIIEN